MKKSKEQKTIIGDLTKQRSIFKIKILGFRSRASFKLIEINENFNAKKYLSTDLGSSPGMVTSANRKLLKENSFN